MDNKITYNNLKRTFDRGTTHLGYNFSEALMEGIDNAFDKGATEVNLKILYELEEERYKFSYIIVDNGKGTNNVQEVFDCVKEDNIVYNNREEYENKNGYFHYGSLAHINIADDIEFISSTEEGAWFYIHFKYSRLRNEALQSVTMKVDSNKRNELLQKYKIQLSDKCGSVLLVRDARIKEFNLLGKDDIEEMIETLKENLGYTYYSEIKEKGKVIKINSEVIEAINPLDLDFLDDERYEKIRPDVFARYSITLDEVLGKGNKIITIDEIYEKVSNIFNDKSEMMSEKIEVTLVALNKNLSRKESQYPEFSPMRFPKYEYGGFYIKRNNRYIGRTTGMLYAVTHPSQTRFRGEIKFNPIFDDFFNIQPNKNKNELSALIKSLIREKIENDKNLIGGSADSSIVNAIKMSGITTDDEIDESGLSEIDSKKINNIINRLQAIHKKREYLSSNNVVYNNNKINPNDIFGIVMELGSPLKVNELIGLTYIIYSISKERFEFDIMDNTPNNGNDTIVKIKDSLFEELKMPQRFKVEYVKIRKQLTKMGIEEDEEISLLEYELKFRKKINKSFSLVSHIISWERQENINIIETIDGKYIFNNEKSRLINYDDKSVVKKVKVLYLKDIIEEMYCEEYEKNTN